MPCEMITLQLGQCGNQSSTFGTNFKVISNILFIFQSDLNFGNAFVPSTELIRRAYWKTSPQKVLTGKMFSSTKPMMSTTFLEQCYWIWNPG